MDEEKIVITDSTDVFKHNLNILQENVMKYAELEMQKIVKDMENLKLVLKPRNLE